jgi:hypothetical protein
MRFWEGFVSLLGVQRKKTKEHSFTEAGGKNIISL